MPRICSIDDCDRTHMAKGLCAKHYARQKNGHTAWADKPARLCEVAGCTNTHSSRGMCSAHYLIWWRTGSTERTQAPKGSGWTDGAGYQRIKINGKTHMKHRLVMEQHIGRELLPSETVHHKNGDRRDNAIGNLELRAGAHGKHQSVEDLVKFAHEILNQYG